MLQIQKKLGKNQKAEFLKNNGTLDLKIQKSAPVLT